jgi:hypothetical protein
VCRDDSATHNPRTSRWASSLLADVPPVRAAEEAAEPSDARGPFVVSEIEHRWPARRRKGRRLFLGESAPDERGGDLDDLITPENAQAVTSRHRDAVQQVELRDLQHVVHLAELASGRGDDRRADGEGRMGGPMTGNAGGPLPLAETALRVP